MQDPAADSGFLGMMKGGAGSLFKNLKDTSSKMAQTVARCVYYVGVCVCVCVGGG